MNEDSIYYQQVRDKLDELYGDTSVPMETTMSHLESLTDEIRQLMYMLKEDMKGQAQNER